MTMKGLVDSMNEVKKRPESKFLTEDEVKW